MRMGKQGPMRGHWPTKQRSSGSHPPAQGKPRALVVSAELEEGLAPKSVEVRVPEAPPLGLAKVRHGGLVLLHRVPSAAAPVVGLGVFGIEPDRLAEVG